MSEGYEQIQAGVRAQGVDAMTRPPPYTNTSKIDIAEHRRALVAFFRLRSYSRRKIFEALQKPHPLQPSLPCINESTGKPWSLKLIELDCQVLLERWRQQALADTGKRQGQQWAEIQELKHRAWLDDDRGTITKCWEREAKLLNLDKQRDPQQGALDGEAQARIVAHQALASRIAALPADQVVSLMKELASARAALPVSTQEIDVTPAQEEATSVVSSEGDITSETTEEIESMTDGSGDDPNYDPGADIPDPVPVWRCPVSNRKIAEASPHAG